ncbi:hypothetical protein B0H65DRAFT_444301 [Neurospora tetraspora]|uniref:Uncharacterized protein n=1 Tax=Neurospora tetraspora TaxID=94610 RepID=A0AAE0JA91_9PEZI|nr:hypothetical protein B0H65DRAFT_444301 [Neurospora tetraspora]
MTGTQMGGGGGGGGVWLSLFSSALSEAVMSDSGKFIYLSTQQNPKYPLAGFPLYLFLCSIFRSSSPLNLHDAVNQPNLLSTLVFGLVTQLRESDLVIYINLAVLPRLVP